MALTPPTAGPRLTDLLAQSPAPLPATGAPQPGSGGVLSNDASMEAILTSPVQQSRVQMEMSKSRLRRLAVQLKEARDVF